MQSIAEELEKLSRLRREGLLSEQEYSEAKRALFTQEKESKAQFAHLIEPVKADASTWGMFIHLSLLCGYVIPIAGWVVPIVLWQWKRHLAPEVEAHGYVVLNWILSTLIYGIAFSMLTFVLIGWPLLGLLAVVSFVYPLMGASKASKGKVWGYPGSIQLIQPASEKHV